MKQFALLAAVAATVAFTAPAFAQDMHHGDRHVTKKVVIKHDRGHHYGWRNHHEHGVVKKKVVIKHGNGKTVIKKKIEG